MIKRYLTEAGQLTPEIEKKLDDALSAGYQRFLTFQNRNGGFGWWSGGRNPFIWTTAYGVNIATDLAGVYPSVDPDVAKRAFAWLKQVQSPDGSWKQPGQTHGDRINSVGDAALPLTGYVVWALARAGFADTPEVSRAAGFLRERWSEAKDPYTLALVANGLVAFDPRTDEARAAVSALAEMSKRAGDAVLWDTELSGYTRSSGGTADVEVTALAALALEAAGGHGPLVDGAALSIVRARRGRAWGSTQATVLALMLLSGSGSDRKFGGEGLVRLRVNGREIEDAFVKITDENRDAVQAVEISAHVVEGENEIVLEVDGDLRANLEVAGRYYLPWGREVITGSPEYDLKVSYDRSSVKKGETLTCSVSLEYTGRGEAFMVIADVAVPPGFTVDASGFDDLVRKGTIAKWTRSGRTITFYLDTLRSRRPGSWSYSLRPRYPAQVNVPRSVAYEYYAPEKRVISPPQELVVTD